MKIAREYVQNPGTIAPISIIVDAHFKVATDDCITWARKYVPVIRTEFDNQFLIRLSKPVKIYNTAKLNRNKLTKTGYFEGSGKDYHLVISFKTKTYNLSEYIKRLSHRIK